MDFINVLKHIVEYFKKGHRNVKKIGGHSLHLHWLTMLEDSLDSIPSPSPLVKIQIIGGKFSRGKFVDNAQQCFAFTPQVNFPAHNFNFH